MSRELQPKVTNDILVVCKLWHTKEFPKPFVLQFLPFACRASSYESHLHSSSKNLTRLLRKRLFNGLFVVALEVHGVIDAALHLLLGISVFGYVALPHKPWVL
eukprot:4123227-Amphidinium_carterae.1